MSFFMIFYSIFLLVGIFFFRDYTLFLLIPGTIALWVADASVKNAFKKWSQVGTSHTAANVAQQILDDNGIHNVTIERIAGRLSDHYDPRTRTIRLSSEVYDDTSIASIAIAAHEVGHAIQHAKAYAPLMMRNAFAPIVSFMSYSWTFIIIAGIFLSIPYLLNIGVIFFSVFFLFSAITLPVEFDASKRALTTLEMDGYLDSQYEMPGARDVLNAAAMTYVASAFMSLMQLIRLIIILRGNEE